MESITNKPTIICLTPVRNEAWILDTFLQSTSLWADHIIIADQLSTDGSQNIALKYPKVRLITNNSPEYNEQARQTLLIEEARKIHGKKLIITLDADEIFTADVMKTDDWQKMLHAPLGSIFGFSWINILPGYKQCWISKGNFPWAFMDDGNTHKGNAIHSPRIPISNWAAIIPLKEICVLHYQYINWERMQSKHVYYQCLERIKFPHKSAIEIFRMYNHMYNIPDNLKISCNQNWFKAYEDAGINVRNIRFDIINWFDKEVADMIELHGPRRFHKEFIWEKKIKKHDKRNVLDKLIHLWLYKTRSIANNRGVNFIDKYLKKVY